jgi:hypothetical protein
VHAAGLSTGEVVPSAIVPALLVAAVRLIPPLISGSLPDFIRTGT